MRFICSIGRGGATLLTFLFTIRRHSVNSPTCHFSPGLLLVELANQMSSRSSPRPLRAIRRAGSTSMGTFSTAMPGSVYASPTSRRTWCRRRSLPWCATIDRFRGGSTVRSWLCGILKHKICDYYRKRGRETSFTYLEFLDRRMRRQICTEGYWVHMNGPKEWKPEADEVMHRDEFWKTMRDCLGKLPERVATVFMMREMDEVESKEICATLMISDSNLWVMLHRARMALRECLAMNWFENPETQH